MKTLYLPICLLQDDTPGLRNVIDMLSIDKMSIADLNNIKSNIMDFMKELRGDLHVIVENDYVDRAYRDSYYDFYSTKLSKYERNSIRLSFFDKEFKSNVDLDDIANFKNNYLGFLILRPLNKCIGRNVIDPKAKNTPYCNVQICRTTVETSCFGVKLKANGFPHSSQDSDTMTCAQTTIWALLEYFGNKYQCYHPTTPSEIENTLKMFSFERQLPSSGLTYNQISVALRNYGFGPKIYLKKDEESFHELIACYIESGIPLAIALTQKGKGHALVCCGREHIDKNDVINNVIEYNKKKFYSWNKTVAKHKFVFNDDNYPCYQETFLKDPISYYFIGDRNANNRNADWNGMEIMQFTAPLYEKVYMDAARAIELSKQIISSINYTEQNVIRTFLTSSRTFREHILKSSSFSIDQRKALLQLNLPKFVWVTELSTPTQFYKDRVNTLLLLDATGSKQSGLSRDILLLLTNSYYYSFDKDKMILQGNPSSYPGEFEAFEGNLK